MTQRIFCLIFGLSQGQDNKEPPTENSNKLCVLVIFQNESTQKRMTFESTEEI